jgi:hypothetical protein
MADATKLQLICSMKTPKITLAILLLLVLGTSARSNAQKGYWNAVDLSQLGYQRHVFDWQAHYPTDTVMSFQLPDGPGHFDLGHTYLKFEIPARGVYFSADLSFMSDLFVGLLSKNAGEKEVYPGYGKYQMLDVLPTKLAFGGFLTDYFALYGGGQWSYRGIGNGDYQTSNITGGNYRGVGMHAMGGPKWLFARYSVMYDWVRRYKRTYKGNAITHEAAIYIAPFKTTAFGFFGRLEFQSTKMNAMLSTPSIPDAPFMPAVDTKMLNFGFGIFMQGLVSQTSKAISKTTEGIYGE